MVSGRAAREDADARGGGDETAATPEIKRSFRDHARAHHPDRHVGSATAAQSASAELFKRISAAYEALRDGDSRKAYQRAVLAGRAD